jgi:drug/metabolite transporter (DMT)-like permease
MTALARVEESRRDAVRERVLPVGAALVTVALWASAFVGIRSAGRDLSPGALALGRLVVGSVALGLLMLLRREPLMLRRGVVGLVVCGVLWFGAYNVALNAAERRVDAGTAAMLVNLGPILVALLAAGLLGEGLPRRLLAGCLVAFGGAAVIGVATSESGVEANWGAVLCFAAAAAYAVGVVAQKPLLAHASALQVTWAACTIGAIVCLPFAPTLADELGDARGAAIGWTIYLGAAPTAIGFVTWAYALARTTAGRMGSTTYLVPPLAVLLGWVLLGESPPGLAFAGGALCLAGVGVARGQVQRLRRRAPAAAPGA